MPTKNEIYTTAKTVTEINLATNLEQISKMEEVTYEKEESVTEEGDKVLPEPDA